MSRHPLDPVDATFFNEEGLIRQRLNDVLSVASDTEVAVGSLQEQVNSLRALVSAHAEYMTSLAVAASVLGQMLSEAGLLDPAVFAARIEATRTAMAKPKEVPEPEASTNDASPYRGASSEHRAQPAVPRANCVKCGKEIPVADTLITAEGGVCQDCYVNPV